MLRRLDAREQARHRHVPAVDRDRARLLGVPALVPGVAAMTLDRLVLVRRDRMGDEELLAHELVHVRQWREHGTVGFVRRYLGGYLAGRRLGLGHREAYLAIALEREARALVASRHI